MSSLAVFRTAMEAVRHIGDPVPPWQDVLVSAKELVGADAATLIMFNGKQDLLLMQQSGVDEAAEQDYREHYCHDDSLAKAALSSPPGQCWDTQQLLTLPSARREPFLNEFLPRHRMRQIMAYVVLGESNRRAAIGFQRVTPLGNASEKMASGRVGVFMRALTQAVAARERAARLQLEALDITLGSLGEAALLVTPTGKIVRYSTTAYEMLLAGKMLAPASCELNHPHEALANGLRRAIARAHSTQEPGTFAVPTSWGEALRLDIVPAPSAFTLAAESTLLVRVSKNSAFSVPGLDDLAAFFALTPAEAKVLMALVAGHSPAEYAATAGLATNTVRNHIASLMRKMACSRQAELVRLGTLLF
jgi:DNA-binding CsgD family transcriptional regulator